jgi:thioredoxin reductase (NADPH)
MSNSHAYDNYFGFPEGVTGEFLLEKGKKQAVKFGAEIAEETVIGASKQENFVIETEKNKYDSRSVIIATGAPAKSSGIVNEEKYSGQGLSYCVTCDGFFFRNKRCAVIGNADFAAHEAIELLHYTKDVTIFTQGKNIEMTPSLLQKLNENDIKLRVESVSEIKGNVVEKLVINGKEEDFQGVFVAVGLAGSADFARKLGLSLEGNSIRVSLDMSTGVEGVFAAGECRGGIMQVAQCVGDGAAAARGVISYLEGKA